MAHKTWRAKSGWDANGREWRLRPSAEPGEYCAETKHLRQGTTVCCTVKAPRVQRPAAMDALNDRLEDLGIPAVSARPPHVSFQVATDSLLQQVSPAGKMA